MGKITPKKEGIFVELELADLTKLPLVFIDGNERVEGTVSMALALAVRNLTASKYPALVEKIKQSMAKVEFIEGKLVIVLTPQADNL